MPFRLEEQEGRFLCWAAVAVSLKRYYSPGSVIRQLDLANAVFGPNHDHVCAPLRALGATGLEYQEWQRPLLFEEVLEFLRHGDPVVACMRHFVGWHLVVIVGSDPAGQLALADPEHGERRLAYDQFVSSYLDQFTWTHSYTRVVAEPSEPARGEPARRCRRS